MRCVSSAPVDFLIPFCQSKFYDTLIYNASNEILYCESSNILYVNNILFMYNFIISIPVRR